ARVIDCNEANDGARALRHELPGQEIRAVLGERQQNLIAATKLCLTPCGSHQIDRFGGSASPDYFLRILRVNECGDCGASRLVTLVRATRERMQSAARVCIVS